MGEFGCVAECMTLLANEHKRAVAVILDRQTFYRDAEDTYQGIKNVDMVPNLSPQNMACVEIG